MKDRFFSKIKEKKPLYIGYFILDSDQINLEMECKFNLLKGMSKKSALLT